MEFESIADVLDAMDELNHGLGSFLHRMKNVDPEMLGLDPRCGQIWVDGDYIITTADNDRSLQYYGGFEYIDSEYRTVVGDYVLYSYECDRVEEHLTIFKECQQESA